MALTEQPFSLEQKLGRQLNEFSELIEVLTMRLLELERRVNLLEQKPSSHSNGHEEITNKLLQDSEERVQYLQGLLNDEGIDEEKIKLIDDLSAINDINNEVESEKFEENCRLIYSDGIDDSEKDIKLLDNNPIELEKEYLDDSASPLLSA